MASAARDMTKDIQTSYDESSRLSGKQFKIGTRTLQEERLLSEGGFGFVHFVRDVASGSPFVVKRILCQDRERYEVASREIEIFEKLPVHPNLVKYYGHTIEKLDGRSREVLILMEYCPGGHLYDMMQKNGGVVPKDSVLKALRDVTAALVALQSMSPPAQHRDLKLENVLLNSTGNFVLVDFGSWSSETPNLSSLTRDELMKFEDVVQRYTTLMYRPPEMADLYKGFHISGKVDIWMLGCILFTMMNNKHPFQDASNLAIVNCRYTFSQDDCKRYPPKLVELCSWLLAQNPDDRPDAFKLMGVLSDWNEEEPLTLPKSVMDRIEKDARLYGIPSMARRASAKESRKKAPSVVSLEVGDNAWGSNAPGGNAASTDSWQADFSIHNGGEKPVFEDLLDLGSNKKADQNQPRDSKPNVTSSIQDLLG
jgi:AP2-associated kinase